MRNKRRNRPPVSTEMSLKDTADSQKDLEELELSAGESIGKEQINGKQKKKTRIILFLIFLLCVAAAVIWTAVREFGSKPPEKLGFALGPKNYAFIAAGFLCMLVTLAVETVKYLLMMKALESKVSVKAAFETATLGKYYDNITPSGIGGQPFQIYNIHRHGYSPGISAAMPLTAFLTMQFGFVFLAILVFLFKGNAVTSLAIRIPAYIGAVTYSILPAGIVIFNVSERAGSILIEKLIGLGAKIRIIKDPEKANRSALKTMREYRFAVRLISRKRGLLLTLFALSFLFQAATCSIPYFVLRAYNGTTPFLDILAMTVFVYCSVTFIPTPGNSGAAESSFYIVFSQLDPTGLFWSMLIWRIICYYSYVGLGFGIYALRGIKAWICKKTKGNTVNGEARDPFHTIE